MEIQTNNSKLVDPREETLSSIQEFLPNLQKLNKLANAIDDVQTLEDGTLYVKYKANVVTEANGSIVNYSRGLNVQIAKEVHLNPTIDVEDKTDIKKLEEAIIASKVN